MGPVKAVLASLLLASAALADVQPIVMKGTKFFYKNGTQFFIKGIAYQQENSGAGGSSTNTNNINDPLANEAACKRDVPILKNAGTNVIRTYAIDPTKDHSACMQLLADAGIYVISDLSSPIQSINRKDPRWDVALYERYTSVIKELAKYPNTLGFFAGNEVTNDHTNTNASAYVKAAVRDTKAYIKTLDRWFGVGYAANDDASIRNEIAHYFNCGNQAQAVDFWGYNIYEWCGESTIQKSGYQEQIDFFRNYSVPVFFAEYGCNLGGGAKRIFQETTALYSNEMTSVFSGGIVYMYFQEANDYGLVDVDGDSVTPNAAYKALAARVAAAKPNGVALDSYTPSNSPAPCPALNDNWEANGEVLPPKPDQGLCDCMFKSLSCVPSKDLEVSAYGDIFGYICGLENGKYCQGISHNTRMGVYGSYSMCNSVQQLGQVLDTYYKAQGSDAKACDFKGKATVTKGSSDSNCKAELASASSANEAAATATSASNGNSAAGAGASSFAVPLSIKSVFALGDFAIGLYVVVAMAVGGAMIGL